MELLYIIVPLCIGLLYWRHIDLKNKRNEQLLKDFISMIIPCRIEKRDGYFFVYNGLNSQFLAQVKTANELEDILVPDRMYMNWECTKSVFDAVRDWEKDCTPLKSG